MSLKEAVDQQMDQAWRKMSTIRRDFLLRRLIERGATHGASHLTEEEILDAITAPSFDSLAPTARELFILTWSEEGSSFSMDAFSRIRYRAEVLARKTEV